MTILSLILTERDGEKVWHNGSMFSESGFCGNTCMIYNEIKGNFIMKYNSSHR